ncbi:imm11 family protein [Capnocytophaga canimorsus]|uniref:Immunity MXAN-0049 protein domain-containing protein n=2 Tax=Capnocytophaga canimorsus TaxID=28188 RepID=F9YW09_CAPCC|nr:hypothetical protein [Capnocytophaga canimorsus]AEK24512.1 Hypothetical protein Ccan_23980 [Capnocytophaga canimorsus Cc5]VEJ19515.1 Uncharacterised protein [Capnocytophaga canimorsus]
MKYYKIEIKRIYPELGRIASRAEGKNVPNADEYFWAMDRGEILYDAPIFDFFTLKSFDEEKYWEWQLNDVHNFIGKGSQIQGWFISEKLKKLFEKFKISKPYCFYPSKLLFKNEKLDYFIFHFSAHNFRKPLTDYITFTKSLFYDPNHKINFLVKNEQELLIQQEKILDASGYEIINVPIKKLVLNESLDFFPMQTFLGDIICSENLKQAIEQNNITGFEFSELDYEVVVG